MKIVLAEDRGSEPPGERRFTADVVKLGRDAAACQFVFDHDEWPMVSRRHAEIRWLKGRCLLVDTNSRFGTFLDGQRLGRPAEISAGARVQLGAGGPLLRVVSIERLRISPDLLKTILPMGRPWLSEKSI